MRPADVVPAPRVCDSRSVTSWSPAAMDALRLAPSSMEIVITGIVMLGSEPVGTKGPETLFTSRQAIAPAFCAFLTLTGNVHRPRSITAIMPFTSAAFVNGVSQPSDAGDTGSWTTTAGPPNPPSVSGAPNGAALPGTTPLPNGTASSGARLIIVFAAAVTSGPSQPRLPV